MLRRRLRRGTAEAVPTRLRRSRRAPLPRSAPAPGDASVRQLCRPGRQRQRPCLPAATAEGKEPSRLPRTARSGTGSRVFGSRQEPTPRFICLVLLLTAGCSRCCQGRDHPVLPLLTLIRALHTSTAPSVPGSQLTFYAGSILASQDPSSNYRHCHLHLYV